MPAQRDEPSGRPEGDNEFCGRRVRVVAANGRRYGWCGWGAAGRRGRRPLRRNRVPNLSLRGQCAHWPWQSASPVPYSWCGRGTGDERCSPLRAGLIPVACCLLPVACCLVTGDCSLVDAGHRGRAMLAPTGGSETCCLLPDAYCLMPRRCGVRRTAKCRPYRRV